MAPNFEVHINGMQNYIYHLGFHLYASSFKISCDNKYNIREESSSVYNILYLFVIISNHYAAINVVSAVAGVDITFSLHSMHYCNKIRNEEKINVEYEYVIIKI